jgi:hypothetical protein
MASKLNPVGTEFQVNSNIVGANGTAFSQAQSAIATLTDGRFAVVYQSQLDAANTDVDISYAFVNPDGTAAASSFVYAPSGLQNQPVAAGRAGGGFGVAWTDVFTSTGAADANPNNINFRTVSSAGVLGAVVAVADGIGTLNNPNITTLSDGRQVVVFDDSFGGANTDIYLNIINAAGTTTAFSPFIALTVDASAPFQALPSIAAQGTSALIVYEDATGGSSAFDTNIVARVLDGTSNTVGAVIPIANHSLSLIEPDVAAIGGGRYAIVYSDGGHVYAEIYNPATNFLTPEISVDASPLTTPFVARIPHVAATADGGFIVTWSDNAGPAPDANNFSVHERRFDPYGNPFGDDFVVNTTTTNGQLVSDVAINGANVLTSWTDFQSNSSDNSPPGIRAQAAIAPVFDYDGAQFGDFNANGRADILFQNVNPATDAAVWQTNTSGIPSSVSSLGPVPAGFRIDGTGNFNGTAGDDILLRSPTSVAVWVMNGTTPQSVQPLGGTSPQWLNSGIGDFTGDGQDDLLFRNPGTNEIATWGVSNNALSTAPKVLGSTSPQFHIVAVDDFTGDGQSDILFRHDNGDIAIWRVANNGLAGAPAVVGSTSTSYHVVATGDFDGNGANDILFRNDNGDLAMWLLNSSGQLLGAPAAIGNAGPQYHVDGTGDLNGDGRADIVFRDSNGQFVEWLMNGTTFAAPPAAIGTLSVDYVIAAHHFDLV